MSLFLIGDSIKLTLLVLLILIFVDYVYNLRTNNIFRRIGMPGPAPIPLLSAAGLFEHGLPVLKDEQWKSARSIVSPTFSSAKLKAMHSLMNDVSDMYNERLLEYADKQEIFDIKTINGQYTLDIIASCLFGVETNSLKNENIILINHLKKFFTLTLTRIFLLFILIARRRQCLERRNDFIQMMIDHEEEIKDQEVGQQSKSLRKTLSDKEILSQALVFLAAGYETSNVLMSFFFYVMATEPVIQEKIYQEIRQEIGDNEVTYEKLNQLQYLDMVINETLRMYPPVLRLDRVASKDYQLGNYLIPKGTIIHAPVYPIHHDSEAWPEPEKSYLKAEKAKRHPMAFLPFGEGPRNCIGMRFALVEAKLGIVRALRLVEFERCGKTEVPLQLGKIIVLNSKNSIFLRVIRRSQ
ncbi:unnamed protein product [Adineta steineri]|uniref:hydroperoxy icosatetraenoate dehydratase n=1 Tax=Adineta steineri TaxID=433720 RepID=A0A814HAQ9_9BILA|nr:unnamed protein product [Adineta steineri]